MRYLALLLVALVGCGDDPPANTAKPAAPTAAPAPGTPAPGAPGAGSGSGKPLPAMRHAENKVRCPTPRSGAKKCDPNATRPVVIGDKPVESKPDDLLCGENEACINTTEGHLCGLCSERFAIRHDFKDRDFAGDNNRDPFQSFIVKVPGAGSGSGDSLPKDPTSRCVRTEQLRVGNYSYSDLKLVGIVSQGTQRKVLMMDPGNYGHIVKRGDCVGKEKAWVKDIGENFICFEMTADQAASNRMPEGQCVELHNKQLTVTQLPNAGPPPTQTVTPVAPVNPQQPQGNRTITVQPPAPQPQPQQPQQPQQPPTNLKP
jgi:Tfp pilus assembly protein PilP